MIKKVLTLALTGLLGMSLASCGLSEGKTPPEEDPYLKKYSDPEAADAWLRKNITEAEHPPVSFTVGGKGSDALAWTKTVSGITTVTDYPDSDPQKRSFYTVTFSCADCDLSVEVLVTVYPEYPVVEYSARLVNNAEKASPEIAGLCSVSGNILSTDEKIRLRYYTGSSSDGESDYTERIRDFETRADGKTESLTVSVTNGKPTSTYLPDFNLEKENGGGVIALLSWQGNWSVSFDYNDSVGMRMSGGQYRTDFNLLEGETHRFPTVVLLFYKDRYVYGQNLYRRWYYDHNFMRGEGVRMGPNILIATGVSDPELKDVQGKAEYDLAALEGVRRYGFEAYVDRFCQDAGWYDYRLDGRERQNWWEAVGNWVTDRDRYPNGLKEVADAAADLGLGYTLWIEPERIRQGSDLYREIDDLVIFCQTGNGESYSIDHPSPDVDGLVNLGKTKAVDRLAERITEILQKSGANSYRQDFNIYPAPYWEAYDRFEAEETGLKRTGRTEEQYCNGYLELLDRLLENNPGLTIDACASGGMRYDLDTARRAYCHTRTDWFGSTEKGQSDTYVTSLWTMYWGTSFGEYRSPYGVRSRLAVDIGIGVMADPEFDNETYFREMGQAIREWRELNPYLLADCYPLTEYLGKDDSGVLALQYDRPSDGSGIVVAFVRGLGQEETLFPYALDPEAEYIWYDYDDKENTFTALGRELSDSGFPVSSGDPEKDRVSGSLVAAAKVFVYQKKSPS